MDCVTAAPAAITEVFAGDSGDGELGTGGVPGLVHEPPQGGGGDLDDGFLLTPSWFSRRLGPSSVFPGTGGSSLAIPNSLGCSRLSWFDPQRCDKLLPGELAAILGLISSPCWRPVPLGSILTPACAVCSLALDWMPRRLCFFLLLPVLLHALLLEGDGLVGVGEEMFWLPDNLILFSGEDTIASGPLM